MSLSEFGKSVIHEEDALRFDELRAKAVLAEEALPMATYRLERAGVDRMPTDELVALRGEVDAHIKAIDDFQQFRTDLQTRIALAERVPAQLERKQAEIAVDDMKGSFKQDPDAVSHMRKTMGVLAAQRRTREQRKS